MRDYECVYAAKLQDKSSVRQYLEDALQYINHNESFFNTDDFRWKVGTSFAFYLLKEKLIKIGINGELAIYCIRVDIDYNNPESLKLIKRKVDCQQ